MIDLKRIREQPELIKTVCEQKHVDVDIDALLALDERRRELATQEAEINQRRKQAASAKDIEQGKALKVQLSELQSELQTVEAELLTLHQKVPNIPSDDTPVGHSEDDNQLLRTVGEQPDFGFAPKAHWDLAEELELLDKEQAALVSGTRFAYLKGDLVRMQFAIVQLALDTLTSESELKRVADQAGLTVSTKPFTPVMPPLMMHADVMQRMARLEPRDERYHIETDNAYLIGSAEHTLGPLHMDQTLDEADLPLRYIAHTSAFRREAGSYGKDTKGMIRLHQFEKAEMVSFSASEELGRQEHELFVALQEDLNQRLGLPYRVMLKCTFDQGTPDARAVDIDTWLPGEGSYRETHTADFMTDYQARRLNTKVKTAEGKVLAQMNDATYAAGRTLVAILENYQQEDGSVVIPEVLRPYMGGKEKIVKPS